MCTRVFIYDLNLVGIWCRDEDLLGRCLSPFGWPFVHQSVDLCHDLYHFGFVIERRAALLLRLSSVGRTEDERRRTTRPSDVLCSSSDRPQDVVSTVEDPAYESNDVRMVTVVGLEKDEGLIVRRRRRAPRPSAVHVAGHEALHQGYVEVLLPRLFAVHRFRHLDVVSSQHDARALVRQTQRHHSPTLVRLRRFVDEDVSEVTPKTLLLILLLQPSDHHRCLQSCYDDPLPLYVLHRWLTEPRLTRSKAVGKDLTIDAVHEAEFVIDSKKTQLPLFRQRMKVAQNVFIRSTERHSQWQV